MGVGGGDGFGPGVMDARVNREGGGIDGVVAFHDFAMLIYQHEIRDANSSEVNAEGIDPEMIGVFGIASGDVAGDTFVVPVAGEEAERGGEALFAMTPFFRVGGEFRGLRNVFGPARSFGHLYFCHL
jgi:hypothetical protein